VTLGDLRVRPIILTLVVLFLPVFLERRVRAEQPAQLAPSRATSRASPDGERVAEVRKRAKGGEAVWVDGRIGWPEAGAKLAPQITSDVVWSKKGDAVAFVGRERSGMATLVVILLDDLGPIAITWPIPSGVSARAVFWLGPQRVAAGPKDLDPKIVATWKTSR
jgi:hypothetical protein